MAFSLEDKHVIKCLRQNKKYSARRLLKEFPNKYWTLRGLNALIRKIDASGSIDRRVGSGRKRTIRTVDNIEKVSELILSQEDPPQTHRSQRQISREVGISLKSVNRIVKQDLQLRCLKKRRAQELTVANKMVRLQLSRRLFKFYPAYLTHFIWFTDKKLFTIASQSNAQNDR